MTSDKRVAIIARTSRPARSRAKSGCKADAGLAAPDTPCAASACTAPPAACSSLLLRRFLRPLALGICHPLAAWIDMLRMLAAPGFAASAAAMRLALRAASALAARGSGRFRSGLTSVVKLSSPGAGKLPVRLRNMLAETLAAGLGGAVRTCAGAS